MNFAYYYFYLLCSSCQLGTGGNSVPMCVFLFLHLSSNRGAALTKALIPGIQLRNTVLHIHQNHLYVLCFFIAGIY